MPQDNRYSTDDILNNLKNGVVTPDDELIDTRDTTPLLVQISNDIITKYGSQSSFAIEACLLPSHLNMFLSGQRKMSRDHLLQIFITLSYDLDTIRTLLSRFNAPGLYPRDKRDYLIIDGILAHKNLDAIDITLINNGFEKIC